MILSVPEKKPGTGAVETRPKHVQAWLRTLPYANTAELARRLSGALLALNRTVVPAQDRFEIMEMYIAPTAAVVAALQPQLNRIALPLTAQKKQLADFLSQIDMEMAYGYKSALRDALVGRQRLRSEAQTIAIERSVRYLNQVLLRAYQIYRPYPPNIWRELHALYEFAERSGVHHERIPPAHQEEGYTTVSRRYKQALLLGLCGPYQLPPNECRQVDQFLSVWADKAVIVNDFQVTNTVGHFLIDLTADAPPIVYPKDTRVDPYPRLRVLNAIGLASTTHAFMSRLQKGETPKAMDLGSECIGPACLDMLRRMVRFWGLTARRQFTRTKIAGDLALCAGLNALHFFASGQKPFVSDVEPPATDEASIDLELGLDDAAQESPTAAADTSTPPASFAPTPTLAEPLLRAPESFRVDNWQVRDESAAGLALLRDAPGVAVRVGELIGIQNEATGDWRVGVARWLKSPDTSHVEMGVEMIAPVAQPVAVKTTADTFDARYRQALLLPALPILRKPASLLVPGGTFQSGQTLYLRAGDTLRVVKPTQLVERSNAFEQILFVEVGAPIA